MENTREKAMNWWNGLCETARVLITDRFHDNRYYNSLTGREIETIYVHLLTESDNEFLFI